MDGSVHKEGKLQMRLVFSGGRTRSAHLPARVSKVHIELISIWSRIPARCLKNTSLSQGCIIEMAPTMGMVDSSYVSREGMG